MSLLGKRMQKGSTRSKRGKKIQEEKLSCEQQRLNIGCTVSRWGIGHRAGEAIQKAEEAGKHGEEAVQQAEEVGKQGEAAVKCTESRRGQKARRRGCTPSRRGRKASVRCRIAAGESGQQAEEAG